MKAENRHLKVLGYHFHRSWDPWNDAPPWAIELRCLLGQYVSIMENMMAQIDDEIVQLQNDVVSEQGAVNSAVTLISGFAAKLDAAVAAAQAAGASPESLKALTDLSTTVKSQTTALADAVTKNP